MSYSRRLAVLIRRGFVFTVSGGAILDCTTLLHEVVLRVVPKLSTFTVVCRVQWHWWSCVWCPYYGILVPLPPVPRGAPLSGLLGCPVHSQRQEGGKGSTETGGLSRCELVGAAAEHGGGDASHHGLRLDVEVSKKLIGAPATDHSDAVAVNTGT